MSTSTCVYLFIHSFTDVCVYKCIHIKEMYVLRMYIYMYIYVHMIIHVWSPQSFVMRVVVLTFVSCLPLAQKVHVFGHVSL